MNTFCGLDFGTSNSTIGICRDNTCELVSLENNKPIIRSAIFCDAELKQWTFGQQGINDYLEGAPGRLMMSLKSVLGSSLMEDKTLIFDEFVPFTHVLKQFMKHIKSTAENTLGDELTEVVLGRPVHFHDHDAEKDQIAQNTLETIARELGFKEISFQFEPIAAALSYETVIQREQLALIVDMGGGTSDFTVIRLHPHDIKSDRSQDVLANCGIHIAGTDFDKRLSLHSVMPLLGMGSLLRGLSSQLEMPVSYYYDLTTWHTLNTLYDKKIISHLLSLKAVAHEKNLVDRLIDVLRKRAGHRILHSVETAKQKLSDSDTTKLELSFIEEALFVMVTREKFNQIIDDDLQKILAEIKETIQLAGIQFSDINAIFYTGGSTRIPAIRADINSLFPNAEIVVGDVFGSVGKGLTLDAQRKYGKMK